LTEKAFALSVYYRTLRGLLPNPSVCKKSFTADESLTLAKLEAFLVSRSAEIVSGLNGEIKIVKGLRAIQQNATQDDAGF
jgi:hypothetical protein